MGQSNGRRRSEIVVSTNLSKLEAVFQDTFQDDEIRVDRATSAEDIEGWDSLMHVTLVLSVEKAFKIRFKSSEVVALKNVGELLDLVEARLGG